MNSPEASRFGSVLGPVGSILKTAANFFPNSSQEILKQRRRAGYPNSPVQSFPPRDEQLHFVRVARHAVATCGQVVLTRPVNHLENVSVGGAFHRQTASVGAGGDGRPKVVE